MITVKQKREHRWSSTNFALENRDLFGPISFVQWAYNKEHALVRAGGLI